MKNIIISMILVLFLSLFINSQAQVIQLLDKSDLHPIPNVLIHNSNQIKSTISDRNGNFNISIFSEKDTLIIRHTAFQTLKLTRKELLELGSPVYLTDNIIKLDKFIVSVSKFDENQLKIPYKVDIIQRKDIVFSNPQTSGELLQQTGNVFLQQSQMGGGSPVLRGFESNKVLLVIDGVRMNNCIYRGGHLQNVITIDPNILENVEVVYGPGSVIYGSDALGGVMNFISKDPELALNGGIKFKAGAVTRYSTANKENSEGIHFNIGLKKIGFLTFVSYKELGDLRAGSVRNPAYGDFGKSLFFVEMVNGKDSMFINPNVNIQKNCGYFQYDLFQKILYKPTENSSFTANFQYSNTGNVPRYDRLTLLDNPIKPRFAEWYYGPQTRLLTSLNFENQKLTKVYDKLSVTAAFQNINEDRINRRFGNKNKIYQEETVDVYSLNFDLKKTVYKNSDLHYGAEAVINRVQSVAYTKDITNNLIKYNTATRYPDNGGSTKSMAVYLSNKWTISPKFIFSQGLRFSDYSLKAEYSDTMMKITNFPFGKIIEQHSSSLNGNVGLVFLPGANWKFALMGSSGFRVPNIDDISKVNDSKSSDKLIIIPNPDLKPEYSYNADFTVGKTVHNNFQMELTGFYTILKDAIALRSTTLNGLDTALFNGVWSKVQTNMNVAEATVYGIQGNIRAQVAPGFSIISNLTYTYGRVKESDVPLDHIPPVFGMTSFKLEIKQFKGELYLRYNGWKRLEDYSPSGEDNLNQATVYGMPAWTTLNIRTAYQINKYLNVQVGMENILDVHYRTFSSGISAPGRNIYLALRANI